MLKKLFTKMQRQIVSFRTVLILLWGASPQAIILLILASSLTGFLTPIGLLCTQHFLDAIVRSVSAGGKFASVVIWLLLLLGVTLFGNLTSMALQTLRANFSDVLALHITQKTLAKYQVIHAEAFEKNARPNQLYYVEKFNAWSFSAFIYPENEEEVLYALQRSFQNRR